MLCVPYVCFWSVNVFGQRFQVEFTTSTYRFYICQADQKAPLVRRIVDGSTHGDTDINNTLELRSLLHMSPMIRRLWPFLSYQGQFVRSFRCVYTTISSCKQCMQWKFALTLHEKTCKIVGIDHIQRSYVSPTLTPCDLGNPANYSR